MSQTIGVLAFQGGVIEHQKIIEKLGHKFIEIRNLENLNKIDRLIIPGGESTVIGFFLEQTGLDQEIKTRAAKGFPIWGTCAGAIVLAKNIKAKIVPPHLKLIDITVERNAYGQQIESFHINLQIPKLKIANLKAAFIRAPIILKTGKNVKILAQYENKPVLVQENKILVSTFHPELTNEARLHEYFISL